MQSRMRQLQKYSSGRRGAPAKGIGRVTGARVQIPPSALTFLKKIILKKLNKLLTNRCEADILKKLSRLTTKQRTLITEQ